MNHIDIVAKYRVGLISWNEMQNLLAGRGYKMIDQTGNGNYYLLPTG